MYEYAIVCIYYIKEFFLPAYVGDVVQFPVLRHPMVSPRGPALLPGDIHCEWQLWPPPSENQVAASGPDRTPYAKAQRNPRWHNLSRYYLVTCLLETKILQNLYNIKSLKFTPKITRLNFRNLKWFLPALKGLRKDCKIVFLYKGSMCNTNLLIQIN